MGKGNKGGNKGANELKQQRNPVYKEPRGKGKNAAAAATAQDENKAPAPAQPQPQPQPQQQQQYHMEHQALNKDLQRSAISDENELPRLALFQSFPRPAKFQHARQVIAPYYRQALDGPRNDNAFLTGRWCEVSILGTKHDVYVQSLEAGREPQPSMDVQQHVERILDALRAARGPANATDPRDPRNRPVFWMLNAHTVVPYETLPKELLPTTGEINTSVAAAPGAGPATQNEYLGSRRPESALAMMRVGHLCETAVRFSNMSLPRFHGCPTCKNPVATLEPWRACHRSGHFLACAAHGSATTIAYGCDCVACNKILERAEAMVRSLAACEKAEAARREAVAEGRREGRRKPRHKVVEAEAAGGAEEK